MTVDELRALAAATLEHDRAMTGGEWFIDVDGDVSTDDASIGPADWSGADLFGALTLRNATPQLAAAVMVLCEQIEWHEWQLRDLRAAGNDYAPLSLNDLKRDGAIEAHRDALARLRAALAAIGGAP